MSTPAKLYRFCISFRQLRFFHWTLPQQNQWKQAMELNIYLKWNCRVRKRSRIDSVRLCWDGTHTLVRCFPSTSFPLLLMPLRKYVCKWTFRTFWKFNSYTFTTTKWEQSQFKRFYRTSLGSSCLWLFFLNNHVLSGLFSICYCGWCCRCCRMLPNSDSATKTTYEAMFTLLPLVCCLFICHPHRLYPEERYNIDKWWKLLFLCRSRLKSADNPQRCECPPQITNYNTELQPTTKTCRT